MDKALQGIKWLFSSIDGFEQSEMTEPKKALESAGAKATIISSVKGKVKGW